MHVCVLCVREDVCGVCVCVYMCVCVCVRPATSCTEISTALKVPKDKQHAYTLQSASFKHIFDSTAFDDAPVSPHVVTTGN